MFSQSVTTASLLLASYLSVFAVLSSHKDLHVFLEPFRQRLDKGSAVSCECVHAADAPICFFCACFDHIKVTFTVCWHWLLCKAIHIFVGAISVTEKKKNIFSFVAEMEDGTQ